MTTPNMVRRQKIAEVVGAFKRMVSVDEAAIVLSKKLREKREEERKQRILSS